MTARRKPQAFDAPSPYPALSADDVCLASGVRIARNIAGRPFFAGAGDTDPDGAAELSGLLRSRIDKAFGGAFSESKAIWEYAVLPMLVRRDYTCPEYAFSAGGPAVFGEGAGTGNYIFSGQADQFVIMSVAGRGGRAGALRNAEEMERTLSKTVNFAWDPDLGYLTASPEDVGSGTHAFSLLHLEGLNAIGELEPCLRAVEAARFYVRAADIDGFSHAGNVFLLRNARTLGVTPREICDAVERVTADIVRQELNARLRLVREMPGYFSDSVHRSIAVLRACRMLEEAEYYDLLSPLRMASSMGFLAAPSFGEVSAEFARFAPHCGNSPDVPVAKSDRINEKLARAVKRFAASLKTFETGAFRLP